MFGFNTCLSIRQSGLLLLCISLTACGSLSKQSCLQGDWRSIGHHDGSKGEQISRFNAHRESCSKYDVKVNFDLYQQGREQGLKSYCRASNGFVVGEQVRSYAGVCPDLLEVRFLQRYADGLESARISTDRELRQAEDDLYQQQRSLRQGGESLTDKAYKRISKEIEQQKDKVKRQEQRLQDIRRLQDKAQLQLGH